MLEPLLLGTVRAHQAAADCGLPRIGQVGEAVHFLHGNREEQNEEEPYIWVAFYPWAV